MNKYAIAFVLALASVSTACAQQQLSVAERMQLRDDCGADMQRLCPGIRPGGGQLMSCIQSKKDQLSKTCSDAIAKLTARKQN